MHLQTDFTVWCYAECGIAQVIRPWHWRGRDHIRWNSSKKLFHIALCRL